MKTINLRGVTNTLSENEMKKVKGGANAVNPGDTLIDGSGGGGSSKCAWSYEFTGSIVGCTNSAAYAEMKAGANGWWCCNCKEALYSMICSTM